MRNLQLSNKPLHPRVASIFGFVELLQQIYAYFVSQTSPPSQAITPWYWGTHESRAFKQSKQLLLSSQLLVHFDPNKELILCCDPSAYGIGAVLAHRTSDGIEQPIGFVSRSLTKAEKTYSQIEKEALSFIFGINRFHTYLYAHRFTLITDHKPLLSLFKEQKAIPHQASGRIQRWALVLAGYEYTISFCPTESHSNADALSRLPLQHSHEPVPAVPETVLLLDQLDEGPFKILHCTRSMFITGTNLCTKWLAR